MPGRELGAVDIEAPYFQTRLYVLSVIEEASLQSSSLPHRFSLLQTLRARHGKTEDGFSLSFYAPFLCLPSLRDTEGYAVSSERLPGDQWPTASSGVKDITLSYSDITEGSLACSVGACKALKTLTCEWGPSTVGGSIFAIEGIGAALQ